MPGLLVGQLEKTGLLLSVPLIYWAQPNNPTPVPRGPREREREDEFTCSYEFLAIFNCGALISVPGVLLVVRLRLFGESRRPCCPPPSPRALGDGASTAMKWAPRDHWTGMWSPARRSRIRPADATQPTYRRRPNVGCPRPLPNSSPRRTRNSQRIRERL